MSLGSRWYKIPVSTLYNIIYDTRRGRHLTKRKNKLKKTQIRKNLKIIRSVKKLTIINFQIQKIDSCRWVTNRWSNRFTAVEKAVNRGLSIEPSLNYDKIHNYDDDGLIIIIWDNPNIYWAINSSQTPFYGTIKSISGLSNQNTIYRHIYFLAINNLFIWWSISFVWLVWTQTTRLFSISRSSRFANRCVFHHMKIEWKWVFWRWFFKIEKWYCLHS